MTVKSVYDLFDSKTIEQMETYISDIVNDIPNDPLSMWYVFYKWNELHGDDLIAFACYMVEKALDFGAIPVRPVLLKKKEGQEKASIGHIAHSICGKSAKEIANFVIDVWNSFGDRKEFLLEHVMDNGSLTSDEYKSMNNFLWGFLFALPEDLSDPSRVDPDDLISCKNDMWGI